MSAWNMVIVHNVKIPFGLPSDTFLNEAFDSDDDASKADERNKQKKKTNLPRVFLLFFFALENYVMIY